MKFACDKVDGKTLTGKQINILARLKFQGSLKVDCLRDHFESSDEMKRLVEGIIGNGYADYDNKSATLKITKKGLDVVKGRSTFIE